MTTPITKPMMYLTEFVEKGADADLLSKMTGFAAERPIKLEVGAVIVAACGENDHTDQ